MTSDAILDALADRTRRRVFESLRSGPMTVRELAELQPVSRPAVSQHLKVLETAGLVSIEVQGKRHYYSIRREGLADLRTYLESFWSDVLGAFAAEIDLRRKKH
jgi:DNA-binding transcriptional ArsR family regulator